MAQQLTQMMASLETTDGCEDRQQTQIHAKDSLDRFGDDLWEGLLSYLTFEDRFRLECVSKQFQRTVFVSVVELRINDRLIRQIQTTDTTITQTMETIAIKCPNIGRLDCRGMSLREEHIPEVINAFGDQLRDIYCNIRPTSDHWLSSYGSLVTRITEEIPLGIERQSLTYCHRLSHLSVFELSDVFDSSSGQLLAKNLQKFELRYNFDENNELLSKFVAQNQCLKSLRVGTDAYDSHETLIQMSQQLSRLRELRELRLNLVLTSGHNSLSVFLRTIGLNCKQLKRLSLQLYSRDISGHTLDSLKVYSRLKRLRLTIAANIDEKVLEPLKLCHRLTHLTLELKQMSDKLLENCDNHWPRLKYLSISDPKHTIDIECLDRISRLPALHMLVINASEEYKNLLDNDFSDLLSKSPKLKTIKIKNYTNSRTFSV